MSDEPWLNCDDIKKCTAQEYQILAAKIMGEMAFVLPSFEHALLYSDRSAEVSVYYLNVDMLYDAFIYGFQSIKNHSVYQL